MEMIDEIKKIDKSKIFKKEKISTLDKIFKILGYDRKKR
jgi:hypothetical protein